MISKLPKDIIIRNSEPSDHHRIINVLKDWWGGDDEPDPESETICTYTTATVEVVSQQK